MADPYAPFEPATDCDPTEKPGPMAFRSMVLAEYGGNDLGIVRRCPPGTTASSLHHEGRAWDWGPELVPGSKPPRADDLAAWQDDAADVIASLNDSDDELARAAGLRTIIFDRRIWIAGKGWKNYGGRRPHTTHVHFGFSRAGAAGATSLYAPQEGGGFRAVPLDLGGGGDGLAVAPPPDTLAAVGNEVTAVRTPLTAQRLAEVLAAGHLQTFGETPSCERLGVAWSQVNLETGRTRDARNFNWGNVIKTPAWEGDFHFLVDDGQKVAFRAYTGEVAGAADYWNVLKQPRYEKALAEFDAGRPEEAAHELHAAGYFSADPGPIGQSLAKFYKTFVCALDEQDWKRRLVPLIGWVAIVGIGLGVSWLR